MNEDKKKIKGLVRESLAGLFEKSKKSKKSKVDTEDTTDNENGEGEDTDKTDRPLDQQDQSSIKNELDKDKNPLAPSISQVMHKVNGANPDDATERSKFLKKVKQTHGQGLKPKEKNATEVALGLK